MTDIEKCCGGPVADALNACCELDALAKAAGDDGCGCSVRQREHGSDMSGSSAGVAVGG